MDDTQQLCAELQLRASWIWEWLDCLRLGCYRCYKLFGSGHQCAMYCRRADLQGSLPAKWEARIYFQYW